MMEKILTVSVAAYNMEKLISENILSFASSKYKDKIELLVINDGSKDNTRKIVEEYVDKYPEMVRLINKENGGAGSTVNAGIEAATAKYFRMVDGDDYVDPATIDEFIEFLSSHDSDIVISNFSTFDSDSKEILTKRSFDLPETFEFDKFYLQIPNEMHAITYKTEIMKKIHKLDNGFYTDVEYVLFPIQYVKTGSYFNQNVYMYRLGQSEQSVNPARMMKNISQHEIVLNTLCDWFESTSFDLESKKKFISTRISIMSRNNVVTLLFFNTSKDNYRRILNFISWQKKYNYLYNSFKKSKLLKTIRYFRYLGYVYVSKKFQRDFGA